MIKSSYITQYIDLLHTILLCLEVEFTVEWQHQSSLLNNYYIILLSVGYEGGHASLIFEVISDFFSEFLSFLPYFLIFSSRQYSLTLL